MKVFKNLDFIDDVVKLAHIKNNSYMWAVAKLLQNENKTATLPITIIIGKITIDSPELSLVIIPWFLDIGLQSGGFYFRVHPFFWLPAK